jgi:hypothetical protein
MTDHTKWGQASTALYTLHTSAVAAEELHADAPLRGPFVLGLWNEAGDGVALEGTRRELLEYLDAARAHVARETDPQDELDQALKRLHTLRQQRGTALDTGDLSAVTRLDEAEVSVPDDVAYAAELVNDDL